MKTTTQPGRSPLAMPRRMAPVPAMAVVALLAVASASALGAGSKTAVVLPLAAGLGLLMVLLASSRFHAYLLLTLAVRSSLDLAKLSRTDGAPRALDPASIVAVVFVMAGLLWLAGQYRAGGRLAGSPLRTSLLIFLAACFLSVAGSGDVGSSLLEVVRIGSVVMMFVVVEQVCADERRAKHVLVSIFASALLPLAVTGAGFLTGHGRTEEKGEFTRVMGTFNQSNEFGRYLMLLIIMGVALYPVVDRRARRPLAALLLGATACLIPTYTRSALLATGIGLLVVGMVHHKKVVLGLLAAAGLALLVVPGLSVRFSDLGGGGQSESVSESTLSWRLDYWREVLPLARQNPVTGVGLVQTQRLTANQQPPHNDFLRAYVETGVLGLLAYLLLLWMLVSTGCRALSAAPAGAFDRGVAAGFLGCAVAFVAVSTVANVFSNVVTLWYFCVFAAAASAVLRRRTAGQTTQELSWR